MFRTIIHMYVLQIIIFANLFLFQFFKTWLQQSFTSNRFSGFNNHALRKRTKSLHKYAINQVTQCESEPQSIETTNVIATLYSKARAKTLMGYKFTATFSEKKVHCSQVSIENKNRSNFIDYEGNILWYYTCTKKVSTLYVFEDKRCYKRIPIFYKNKVHFVDTLSRRTFFWDTAVPCWSKNSHNVVHLNPDEDKYYLLTP